MLIRPQLLGHRNFKDGSDSQGMVNLQMPLHLYLDKRIQLLLTGWNQIQVLKNSQFKIRPILLVKKSRNRTQFFGQNIDRSLGGNGLPVS